MSYIVKAKRGKAQRYLTSDVMAQHQSQGFWTTDRSIAESHLTHEQAVQRGRKVQDADIRPWAGWKRWTFQVEEL